ncbi:small GTP-binding protein [Tritrichomonas foetus]|uniref:Small GTP-binding protein n=1 Tax=Tritrichomonas foetus TaxID=1144522 RepID=A0A1J4L0E6_9EUKA|nr:small GTP-binding protein [Tritrichomonas foetus]|eukprot:OHT16939.1 small GTP-binding protein [Tritrichomonas foetus]
MIIADDVLMARAVLIGDSSVGKTCLVNQFIHNEFNPQEVSTIGALYETYSSTVNGKRIELQIWDTSGQEKFKSLGPVYYRDAAAAILVFDLTSRNSFLNLSSWLNLFKNVTGGQSIIVVVGNKKDLSDSVNVTENEAREWAASFGYNFFVTSAKNGEGVKEVFESLMHSLVEKENDVRSRVFQQLPKKQYVETNKSCGC